MQAGKVEAERQAQQAEEVHSPKVESVRAKESQPAVKKPDMLLVEMDGGWIPSRDQPKGMEGKVRVLATQTESVGRLGRKKPAVRRLAATFGTLGMR